MLGGEERKREGHSKDESASVVTRVMERDKQSAEHDDA